MGGCHVLERESESAYLEEEPPALRPAHVPEGADQGAHVACVFCGCGMVVVD